MPVKNDRLLARPTLGVDPLVFVALPLVIPDVANALPAVRTVLGIPLRLVVARSGVAGKTGAAAISASGVVHDVRAPIHRGDPR
jgi:hypothetical protein